MVTVQQALSSSAVAVHTLPHYPFYYFFPFLFFISPMQAQLEEVSKPRATLVLDGLG